MSPAARSVFAFGLYLAAGGFLLLLAPEAVCRALGMSPPDQTVWMRLCGMFFLDLTCYCVWAARNEQTAFIRATVYTRPWTLAFVAMFAALGVLSPAALAFGLIDALAALWTARALRQVPSGYPPAAE